MNPEGVIKKQLWLLIKKIKEVSIISQGRGLVAIELDGEDESFSIDRQISILYLLAESKILRGYKVSKHLELGEPNVAPEPRIMTLDVNYEKLDVVYNMLKDSIDDTKYTVEEILQGKSNAPNSDLKKFVKGARWNELTLKLLGDGGAMLIRKKINFEITCESLGLQDNRTGNPNLQYKLLELLSMNSGELDWKKVDDLNLSLKKSQSFKKSKQLLSSSLQDAFGIDEEPFYSYKKEKSYRLKMNLIPPNYDDTINTNKHSDDDLEFKEAYDAQTPLKYDKSKKL